MARSAVSIRRVTMTDVARKARVSQQAVSAVLSGGSRTVSVSLDTSKRIIEAARRLNYSPNLLARGLANRRTFLIGVLCRDNFAPFVYDTLYGVQDVLGQREYSLVSYTHGDTIADELVHLRRSVDRRVDGLIVMPALEPDGSTNVEHFSNLRDQGMPIVQLFTKILPGIPAVVRDCRGSGRQAVEHLVERGHRSIIHLTHGRYNDMNIPAMFGDARDRAEGYTQAMRRRGLEPVVLTTPRIEARTQFAQFARDMAGQVLHHPSHATGVVAYNDYIAQGLAKGLMELGAGVPQDFSIVGSDDLEIAALSIPSLTTLSPPIRQCGRVAAEMIFHLMEHKKVEDRVLPHDLVIRESTRDISTTAPIVTGSGNAGSHFAVRSL